MYGTSDKNVTTEKEKKPYRRFDPIQILNIMLFFQNLLQLKVRFSFFGRQLDSCDKFHSAAISRYLRGETSASKWPAFPEELEISKWSNEMIYISCPLNYNTVALCCCFCTSDYFHGKSTNIYRIYSLIRCTIFYKEICLFDQNLLIKITHR